MTPLLRAMAVFAFFGLSSPLAHSQHRPMPEGMTHEQHMAQMKKHAEMKRHGHLAMGFDQDKATQIKEHATGAPVSVQNGAAQPPGHGAQTTGAHPAPATQGDHFGRHFDNAVEWAKRFDDPARDAWQMPARVIDALQLQSGQLVADIGAGTGYFTVRLAKSPAAPKVYAVDIEPSMVEYVKQRAVREGLKNVVAVQAGPERTNLPESVDLVLVVDTYHHIPSRVAYFTALKARMKPGARLAIVDFRKDSPEGPPVEFRFTPDQISAELAKAGFSLQTSHDFLPRQIFLIYNLK
jgi:SAM-dependent methyltransferase